MSDADDQPVEALEEEFSVPRRKRRWRVLAVLGIVLFVAVAAAWLARERIANRIIAGELRRLDLPATYELVRIGTRRQILKNVVIGDLRNPDLTVEQIEIELEPRLGLPTIDRVTLIRPRLIGTYREAKASFGTLDKLIFTGSDKPAGLPDLDLVLIDGRARLDSDFGQIGIKADGRGNLRDGFNGIFAAVGPRLAGGGCSAGRSTLYGKLTSKSAQLGFEGPLRFTTLACPAQGLALSEGTLQINMRAGEQFDSLRGTYGLASNGVAVPGASLASLGAMGDLTFAKGDVTASYVVDAKGVGTGWADAADLALEGIVRSRDELARFEAEGTVGGNALRPGPQLNALLARYGAGTSESAIAPIARQIGNALSAEGRASRLGGTFVMRQNGELTSLSIPRLTLRGSSGADVVSLSRALVTLGAKSGPRFAGAIRTGGAGLPEIEALVEKRGSGADARLTMREYKAGATRIALPELRVVQVPGGAIGFAGMATLSGKLPGGEVENLIIPIEGNWSGPRGLAMWRRCTTLRFDRLQLANLRLDPRAIEICPGRAGAILASDANGTRFAGGTGALDLTGRLGSTPLRFTSGAIGLAWPGAMAARDIGVSLGKPGDPTTLKLAEVRGQIGTTMAGTFNGAEVKLNNVPIDVLGASGRWTYSNNRLAIRDGAMEVRDRLAQARFNPLISRSAALDLKGSNFLAQAVLREPKSDREVVHTKIVHDLDTGVGYADLDVPGLVFDSRLQPDTLTYLAQGVIALAEGTVTGTGRIDWNARVVTSTGRFRTDKLDFAAAFGPVEGVSGTVEFTDLLGLVTARDQQLKIASINPGIEVRDGVLSFQLEPGQIIYVNGARWPFIDGTLELLPTRLALGTEEDRRFTLRLEGASAARFVAQLELGNLSATGIFDGTLPLVFDQNGGRIVNGLLISRPPGGNVSYIGELTYQDMGAMANFAFQSLRSLDYQRMEIGIDGALEGDIVTRLRFSGVTQGAGAKRSIISRSIGGLPIQFNVNIRAPFQRLIHTLKELYDPTFIRDPRELGLVDKNGNPIRRSVTEAPPPPPVKDPLNPSKSQAIQPPVSETRP